MKDIQAATMAIPTSSSSSKDSAFKVSIDVKDLEKVEKILYILLVLGILLVLYLRIGM